ncbi:flagellar motor protein [Cohnella pontilimi]|uniref:Flagellar motor protein n=1 Tax=Cohnella pontilimi TaxID=2564100 RepID=A0A4U0FAY1_9BACL|nr:flagellar motor protein MotB [Cohnella pontilimi]TJY41983.1 flagellar motor protein [Cohnella pontilimi]
MRRRNKRNRGGHENHERWLITYADLITLLMIFFVVLYAMSQIDIKKYDALAQTLQHQFRKADSVLEQGTGVMGGTDRAKYETPSPSDAKETAKNREQALQDLLHLIEKYVKDNRLEKQVFVEDTPKGIAIRLSDQFLFSLGRADLKPGARPVLDRMSVLLGRLNTTISIQGHTDNLPIQPGGAFQDNWGLSASRALSVLRYFVDVKGLEEKRFEVAGYADTRPIAKNDTEANRQKNRRVEILVLRQEKE